MILPPGCHRRTLLRYLLLQLPGTALLVLVLLIIDHFRPLPDHWFWGILLLWLGKETVLFPLTWRSWQPEPPKDRLIGQKGRCITDLAPQGSVRLGHELWQAQSQDGTHLDAGTRVRVTGRTGIRLEVKEDQED